MGIAEIFEKHEEEFLKFERIEIKLSNRADIHAFILLDRLFPGERDIIAAAEHDEIYLDVEPEELIKVASELQLVDLIRCGVFYDKETCGLAMYV